MAEGLARAQPRYDEAKARRYLTWLAREMQQRGVTVFMIEDLQPAQYLWRARKERQRLGTDGERQGQQQTPYPGPERAKLMFVPVAMRRVVCLRGRRWPGG